MKTAKEWFKEMTRLDKDPPSWHDWVKMIQADTRHAALTEAAEIAGRKSVIMPHYDNLTRGYAQARGEAYNEIIAYRDNPKPDTK